MVADAFTKMELLQEELQYRPLAAGGTELSPGARTDSRPVCSLCAQVEGLLQPVAEV